MYARRVVFSLAAPRGSRPRPSLLRQYEAAARKGGDPLAVLSAMGVYNLAARDAGSEDMQQSLVLKLRRLQQDLGKAAPRLRVSTVEEDARAGEKGAEAREARARPPLLRRECEYLDGLNVLLLAFVAPLQTVARGAKLNSVKVEVPRPRPRPRLTAPLLSLP